MEIEITESSSAFDRERRKKKKGHLDIDKDMLKGISVGDTVTVVITGAVTNLALPYVFEEADKERPSTMDLDIEEIRVKEKENAFTRMAEDDLE